MLLAHHPDLVTLGEFLNTRERKYHHGEGDFCSCGQKLTSCPYMNNLTQMIKSQGMDFSVDFPDTAFRSNKKFIDSIISAHIRGKGFETLRHLAITLLPPVRKSVNRIISRNSVVISTLLDHENSSVYLDSAKNNRRVLYFDRYAPNMDVKVIWLTRDGRGVANSYMKHKNLELGAAIRSWASVQESVIRTAGMISKNQLMKLKYEDFCKNPEKWLPEVCRFLELDPKQLPETFGGEELHLTGNNMRLNGLSEIRMDEKWRALWSSKDVEQFSELGGGLNQRLGYGAE